MRGYFYRGRHRRPTKTARRAATLAATGAVGLGLSQGVAYAGPPGGWDPVIKCESGGNPKAQNPSSSASGLLQFIDGTWRAYGGHEFAARAKLATAAEQLIVAERAYAREGLQPWTASKSCWSGKVSKGSSPAKAAPKKAPVKPAPAPAPASAPAPAPALASAPAAVPAVGTYVVQLGDTLSEVAAVRGDGNWQALHERNRAVVGDNPNLIFPGQNLSL